MKHHSSRRGATTAGTGAAFYVSQGEHIVSSDPDATIAAVLGSCVAACVWDSSAGVGGMNHILLPDGSGPGSAGYGASLMERMLNDLYKAGAQRSRLRAKCFGGSAMISGLSDIGVRNAEFVSSFLRNEGIVIERSCFGGNSARHVRFSPVTGKAQMKRSERAPEPVAPAPKADSLGAVDLF